MVSETKRQEKALQPLKRIFKRKKGMILFTTQFKETKLKKKKVHRREEHNQDFKSEIRVYRYNKGKFLRVQKVQQVDKLDTCWIHTRAFKS